MTKEEEVSSKRKLFCDKDRCQGGVDLRLPSNKKNRLSKKIIGLFLILIGFFALITPFTPGSWLIFVGLGMFGLNIVFWNKIKIFLNKMRDKL